MTNRETAWASRNEAEPPVRMTFGSKQVNERIPPGDCKQGGLGFSEIRPPTGRWIVESVGGDIVVDYFRILGIYRVSRDELESVRASASLFGVLRLDPRLSTNWQDVCAGNIPNSVMNEAIYMEGSSTLIGGPFSLAILYENNSVMPCQAPCFAAVCRRIEK